MVMMTELKPASTTVHNDNIRQCGDDIISVSHQ